MTDCPQCGGPHPMNECPMFAKTEVYLQTFAPGAPTIQPPPEDATASSLAPTQFEQLFGRESGLLMDVMDDDTDQYSPEEKELAHRIVVGDNDFAILKPGERALLDGMVERISSSPPKPATAPVVSRPSYISTQGEMENFNEEYQPPPHLQDWPGSDFPEGDQG